MKIKTIPMLLLGASIFFSSCEKEDKNDAPSNTPAPAAAVEKFGGTYDGNSTFAAQITGRKIGDYLSITGYIGNDSIALTTTDCNVGTYTTASNGINGFYYYTSTATYSTAFVNSPDAVINITSYDPTNNIVSGVYSGSMRDLVSGKNMVVTQGEFSNIKLKVEGAQQLGEMTAQIDGAAFSSYFCAYQPNYQNGMDIISGSNIGVSKSITFQISSTITVGSYDLDGMNNMASYIADLSSNSDPFKDIYNSTSGTLKVTSKTANEIKGTFFFTASNFSSNVVEVTQGSFTAAY